MLNDLSSPAALVASRRSGKPRDMIAPGPDPAVLRTILQAAIRTPDHGKLAPWRFVIVPDARRGAFEALLKQAYAEQRPDAGKLEIAAIEEFARQAPTLVVALSTPAKASKIPIWEQELSAGAACMNLLHAVHAHGFVGGWLSGWAAFSDTVKAAFGGESGDRIAGFIFIGSPGREPEERPRPDYDSVVSIWESENIA